MDVALPVSVHDARVSVICKHGEYITYAAMLEGTGNAYIAALASALHYAGFIKPIEWGDLPYAYFDLLNAEDELIESYGVMGKPNFEHLQSSLGLRIASSGCDDTKCW